MFYLIGLDRFGVGVLPPTHTHTHCTPRQGVATRGRHGSWILNVCVSSHPIPLICIPWLTESFEYGTLQCRSPSLLMTFNHYTTLLCIFLQIMFIYFVARVYRAHSISFDRVVSPGIRMHWVWVTPFKSDHELSRLEIETRGREAREPLVTRNAFPSSSGLYIFKNNNFLKHLISACVFLLARAVVPGCARVCVSMLTTVFG